MSIGDLYIARLKNSGRNVILGRAGDVLPKYTLVYSDSADSGKYKKADQDLEATSQVAGIVLDTEIDSNAIGEITISPTLITYSSWTWIPGGALYLSSTPGSFTQTKPTSGLVVPLGYAVTSTQIYFTPKLGAEFSPHNLIDTTGHPVTGLTTGHIVTATAATTYGFQDLGLAVAGYTAKTAPVDTDYIPLMDSETTPTANLVKKLSWAYVKSVLKTYFDGLYTLANLGGVPTTRTVAGHELSANVSISATDVGLGNVTNAAQLVTTQLGAASGVASLNISTKVVQDPANATATPTASKIPIADANGRLNDWVDTSAIENTLTMIAWDTYSEDRAFDDIYVDDFTDATGIDGTAGSGGVLSGNSTGIYDSVNALAKSGITGLTVDVTTSQIDCSSWGDINSVAITQTTPTGTASNSAIYHAVSFDNAVTYKVFKTTWLTVAYNNSGTWQYNAAGSLANASTNSLAGALAQSTAQSAYQWTKTNIEAMADADWNATGGWSTSVTTVDWAKVLVSACDTNASTTTATATLSADGTTVTANHQYGAYYIWEAFNGTVLGEGDCWVTNAALPHWIAYNFGSGKIINKYSISSRDFTDSPSYFPASFKLQGSFDNSNWADLDTQTGISHPGNNTYWNSTTLANNIPYQYYRIYITATSGGGTTVVGEIKLIEASLPTAPTFTKATINYNSEHIPLSLISNGWESSANDPTAAYCVLDIEPVDTPITNNTDLKAWVCIDGGATPEHYEQIDLEDTPFREIGVHDYIRGDLSGITARTDKTIRLKITSENNKAFKLHAWAIGVKY